MMPRLLETFSLLLLLVLAALRPLIPESYDSAGLVLGAALGPIHDPAPVVSLIFDLGILLAAGCCFAAWALGGRYRYRRTGLEWGLALMVIAGIISCIAADQKRLAINATVDWLCMPLLTIVLVQLLRAEWQRRLLLAVVLASACVQMVECLDQYFFRFDDTWAQYQSIKEEFWASQGVEPGAGKIEMFERRIGAHEAQGFLPHSNVTASYLLLCGLMALGASLARFRRDPSLLARVGATAGLVVAGGMLATILLTGSLGATLAVAIGAALWLMYTVCEGWITRHRARFFALAWGVILLGVAATIGHGLYHGGFPNMSMTFRWHYWQTSAKLIADHPYAGVGRENFGRHYLAHKPIHASEEVSNPHNLPVQVWSELGSLGLIATVLMILQASWTVVRWPLVQQSGSVQPRDGPAASPIAWALVLIAAVVVLRIPLMGVDDPNYVYYNSVLTGFVWLGGFALFGYTRREHCSGVPATRHGNRLISIGLLAFLLHEMINFAMFVPGTATTFFVILSIVLAGRVPVEAAVGEGRVSLGRWFPAAAATATFALAGLMVVRPVALAGGYLNQARAAIDTAIVMGTASQPPRGPTNEAVLSLDGIRRLCETAARIDPLDPVPLAVSASALVSKAASYAQPQGALREAVDAWTAAIARDPHNISLRNSHARTSQMLAEATGLASDWALAIEAAENALQVYPLHPHGMERLADILLRGGKAQESKQLLFRAVEEYERALTLDDARPPWAKLSGYNERRRDAIQLRIQRARALIETLS